MVPVDIDLLDCQGGDPLGCGFVYDAEDTSGQIRAVTCQGGTATCLGADPEGVVLLVSCTDAIAKGWKQQLVGPPATE